MRLVQHMENLDDLKNQISIENWNHSYQQQNSTLISKGTFLAEEKLCASAPRLLSLVTSTKKHG